ncbi:MAG: hypothetical protein E6J14_04025 [Chloroflexi bacterium]|nr:MAG: hypothetical protein E6J14_04025 [Chloroflexota bacterium]
MLNRIKLVRRLLIDLPRYVKLTYCLLRDPRVPATHKAAMGAALAMIVTPFIDIPMWVPVVGEMDVLALTLLAARLFVATAPAPVVAEHDEAIRQHRSRFDGDVARGQRLAVALAARLHGGDTTPPPDVPSRQPRPAVQAVKPSRSSIPVE